MKILQEEKQKLQEKLLRTGINQRKTFLKLGKLKVIQKDHLDKTLKRMYPRVFKKLN
jgi:hypothetical protein